MQRSQLIRQGHLAGLLLAVSATSPAISQSGGPEVTDTLPDSGRPATMDMFTAPAGGSHNLHFEICAPEVRLTLTGQETTDLDFIVWDEREQVVYSDYGDGDRTSTLIAREGDEDCQALRLLTINRGERDNEFVFRVADESRRRR